MTRSKKFTGINWGVWIILYALFLGWHGAFERPLSEDEIEYYSEKISAMKPAEETAFIKAMLKKDKGKPIFMVNAIKLRDQPLPMNGENEGKTVEEVLNNYNSFVLSFLLKRGSYPIYLGEAHGRAAASWGIENAEEWSSGVIVRYRSLRTLLKMATSPAFQESHEFKIAGIEKTIAYPTNAKLMAGGLQFLVFFILLSAALGAQLMINRSYRSNKHYQKVE